MDPRTPQQAEAASIELSHFQSLRAIAREMRGAIIGRDLAEIERLTALQRTVCEALAAHYAAASGRPDPTVRAIAQEVRAESAANEALLRENLEVIDRLVRALAKAPDAGTYAPPRAPYALAAASRASTALISRTA